MRQKKAPSVYASPFVASGSTSYKNISSHKGILREVALKDSKGNNEYLLILRGGKVYADGKVLTTTDLLIEEAAVMGWGKSIKDHHLLKYKKEDNAPTYTEFSGRLAVVASSGAGNYYHWMMQILPRIEILQASGVEFDKLYFYDLKYPYQFQTLKALGVKDSDYIIGKADNIVIADTLIVPSIPNRELCYWPRDKTFSSHVLKFLEKKFFVQNTGKNFPKKIFISRQKAMRRNIVNENEIIKALKKKGYAQVFLEDYSVQEQASMFFQAKAIIGMHGSGLTNLVFCQPKTKVLEIDPADGHRGPFKGLAIQKDLCYQHLKTSQKGLERERLEKDDVIVPLVTLLQKAP